MYGVKVSCVWLFFLLGNFKYYVLLFKNLHDMGQLFAWVIQMLSVQSWTACGTRQNILITLFITTQSLYAITHL